MKLDILAFGSHPDDVELSCSGTLIVEKQRGKKIGIIDLTMGELGTRGNAHTRSLEAQKASEIMQLDVRENLQMPDGFFENNKENQLKIIEVLRKYKPEIVLCNAVEDRHPDHGKAASLISDACFLSGLRKIETQNKLEAWRPKQVYHYIQDRYINPDFVYDISNVMDIKLKAIKAYTTQFDAQLDDEPQTYISKPEFLDSVIYRAKMFGKMVGVSYAEGYTSKKVVGITDFDSLIHNIT